MQKLFKLVIPVMGLALLTYSCQENRSIDLAADVVPQEVIDKLTHMGFNPDGIEKIDEGYRADLIVNQQMLVELKSVEKLDVVHSKQVLTYLKLTNLNLGLLINFGAPFLKEGIRRIVNNLKEKNLCVSTALREASTNYYESRKPFFLRAQAS